jgi:hypothetical protein
MVKLRSGTHGWTIERSGDTVCGLQHAQGDEEHKFLGLVSKPMSTVSPGLASKSIARVCRFGPQNRQLQFGDLAHKITVTVAWFGPQNHVGFGWLVAPQNQRRMKTVRDTRRDLAPCFAWKQVRLGFPSLAS